MKTKSCTWPAGFLLAVALGANAQTTSGLITGSESWSNKVNLTGDVTVTPTGSLTILPGTRIEADPRSDDQIGGIHSSRIELIVDEGVLAAVGTDLNPIVFTTGLLGTNSPAPGDWASLGQVVIRSWSATMLHPSSPSIVVQPQSQLVTPGANVRFDVVAVGSPPLDYQWWKDTTEIQGATNASLVLTNVQMSAAGNYFVTVTNSLGGTNSVAATLTVDLSALGGLLSLNMYAGISFSGAVGKTYSIQCLSDLSRSNNWFDWTALTNFTLQSSPASFIDWNSPGASRRFYRAVQLP